MKTDTQGNVGSQASAQSEQGSSGDEYVLSAEEDYSNKDGGTISKDAKIMIIAACITAAVGALSGYVTEKELLEYKNKYNDLI